MSIRTTTTTRTKQPKAKDNDRKAKERRDDAAEDDGHDGWAAKETLTVRIGDARKGKMTYPEREDPAAFASAVATDVESLVPLEAPLCIELRVVVGVDDAAGVVVLSEEVVAVEA